MYNKLISVILNDITNFIPDFYIHTSTYIHF